MAPEILDGTWRGTLSDDDLQIEWQPAAMTEQAGPTKKRPFRLLAGRFPAKRYPVRSKTLLA